MASLQAQVIYNDLDQHISAMSLTQGNLVSDLMDIAVEEMQVNMAKQIDPDGKSWDELSPAYAERKSRTHPGKPISELEGLMGSDDEMNGFRIIEDHKASLTYGVSPEAKVEAEWFQDPDDTSPQPPRVFWGLTEEAIRRSGERVHKAFD